MEGKTELQRNAFVTARRKELELFQRALDIQWLNSRMESGRMGRCLALIQQEAQTEKEFQERTDHAAIVNARAAKEAALGVEIEKVRHEEICNLARRHYLRQRDPSLRVLEKKLQAGYVCRDLQQQILHNQYKKLQEKAEANQANDYLLKALYNDFEAKEKEDREKMEQTTQYCKELQQQLVNRQLQKQCQYEETLIEKKMLEEVMRTLADEDQRELKQKKDLTEKTRKEMVTFQKAREAWREKQKKMVILEEKEIEEQLKMLGDRSVAVIAERERKQKIKEELNDKVAAKIMADEAARLERINLIKLLQEQELLEKNVQDDILAKEKQERVRKDTMDALTAQMENKKKVAADMKEKEVKFRKENEAKMAADMAEEREKELKKREKAKLYSQELLKQIAANRVKKEKEEKLEAQRADYVWECDRKWRAEVSGERRRMVAEHAPALLGYLQAGVLQRADLPALGAGAATRPDLRHLDVDALAHAPEPKRRPKCNAQCRVLREY
ncbi:unnamed protein product [Arctia plantaginis]|uniref:Meiosis-specific nuclear structural protein 1 n=1 Tax=Arctia plantaginis TaxID=874455 RepID=A0A8S1BLS6_ARCPL|nr:unnamed protein product [Arctia plantaginis]